MQLDKVIINGQQLALVDSSFASIRPGYTRTVTINFTNGKLNDPRWGKEKKETQGLTKPSGVRVDEASQTCTGEMLIDLYEILSKSVTPAQKIGRQQIAAKGLSPKTFRYLTVVCIVHELVHVHEGWQKGAAFARSVFDEKLSAAARAHENAKTSADPLDANPYLLNQIEQRARDFAARWGSDNSDGVHSGKFDFLLPMITMRGIFPDIDNPY